MKRYLLDSQGSVEQTIELEDGAEWIPPTGSTLAAKDFVPPPVTEEDTEPDYRTLYSQAETVDEKLDLLAKVLGLID